MSKSSSGKKLLALILVTIGVALAGWAYQLSQTLSARLTQTFTGGMDSQVMYLLIAAGVCLVAGLFLSARK
ncbi:MAG: DUF3185 family protein [Gammaproteobacteria bacterium]|nr:DUF3185 family protein [Gammaproteobacteria bacterium]